jgi:hypothetical protein
MRSRARFARTSTAFQKTIALRAVIAAGIFSVGFIAGLQPTPDAAATAPIERCVAAMPETDARRDSTAASPRKRREIRRPYLIRPIDLFQASDPKEEHRYHEQQSREVLNVLRTRLRLERLYAAPDETPEGVATPVFNYMNGLVDGLIRTAPDLVDELASQVERAMCDASSSPEEMVALSHMISLVPELASARGFECLFSLHTEPGREDTVTWFGLDAWKTSKLPKTSAIAALELYASDPRTLQRFKSGELRMAAFEDSTQTPLSPDPLGPRPLSADAR